MDHGFEARCEHRTGQNTIATSTPPSSQVSRSSTELSSRGHGRGYGQLGCGGSGSREEQTQIFNSKRRSYGSLGYQMDEGKERLRSICAGLGCDISPLIWAGQMHLVSNRVQPAHRGRLSLYCEGAL